MKRDINKALCLLLLLLSSLQGCSSSSEQEALGTLEWDRVNSRAPAGEIILDILVDRGDRVKKGDLVLMYVPEPFRSKRISGK